MIVPGTCLFAVAVLAGSGALSLGETLLLGFLGGVLGDVCRTSWAGISTRTSAACRVAPPPEWMAGAETYFQRYGIASLLVGRFIGPLRPMLPMVAGMFDMPFPRFFAVSLLAAAGWSVAYLLPGWATGAAIRLPLPEGFWLQAGIVAGSIAVMVGLSATSSRQPPGHDLDCRHECSDSGGLFIGYPYLTALDQGVMTLVQEHRSRCSMKRRVFTLIGEFRNMLLFSALLTGLLLLTRQWRPAIFAGGALMCTHWPTP
jgi:undecaprenyl-diphosphatase